MRCFPLIPVLVLPIFRRNMEFCWIAVTRTLHSSELTVSSCISYDELLAVQLPNVTESKCVAEVKSFLSYQYGEMAAIAFIIIAGVFNQIKDYFTKKWNDSRSLSATLDRYYRSENSETLSTFGQPQLTPLSSPSSARKHTLRKKGADGRTHTYIRDPRLANEEQVTIMIGENESFSWFRFGKRNSLYIKQYSLEPVEMRRVRIIATFWVFKVRFGTIKNAVRAFFNRKIAENCINGVICGFYRIQINAAIQIW